MEATPLFNRIWNSELKRVNVLRGGSRSSKTFSLMQMVFLWLVTGKIANLTVRKGTFSVVRKTFPALRTTAMKDFHTYLHTMGAYDMVRHKKSIHEYQNGDREVIFFSADDEHKLRGRQHTFFWMNEADGLEYEDFHQMIMRTEQCCFLDCNPSNSDSWVKTKIEDLRTETHGDVKIDVSTYHDNPFLNKDMRTEIEMLKETDADLYRVYAKGEWIKLRGLIYKYYEIVEDQPKTFDKEYLGLDFGFANDPTAIVNIRTQGKQLFIKEVCYNKGMLNSEIAERLEPYRHLKIYADPSEPKSIEYLRREGFRIKASSYKARDINAGIEVVKMNQLNITADSHNLLHELKYYKYKKDKEGQGTNVPIDAFNHLMDAMRYAIVMEHKRKPIKMI